MKRTAESGSSIMRLRRSFDRLDWTEHRDAHAVAAREFAARGGDRLKVDLEAHLSTTVDLSRSVEKTSHYKWYLGGAADGSYELWLHEYKPRSLRREGHATVAHNHRFWLSSIVLRGGFTDSRFGRDDHSPTLLRETARRRLAPNDTMVIDADEIHSLSELDDGTVTLVVQSAPVRSYSEVFEEGRVSTYFDLEAKLTDLGESLRGE
jgi:hypothetical protein